MTTIECDNCGREIDTWLDSDGTCSCGAPIPKTNAAPVPSEQVEPDVAAANALIKRAQSGRRIQ